MAVSGSARLDEESDALRDAVSSDRGSAVARARLEALVDAGSFFEVGRFTRSQHGTAGPPADGLFTGFARVHGHEIAVISQTPTAVGTTDSQVARSKRDRLLRLAAQRGLPVALLVDASAHPDTPDDPREGALLTGLAPQAPLPALPPTVAIVFGQPAPHDAEAVWRADVVVAVQGVPGVVPDCVATDEADALHRARLAFGFLFGTSQRDQSSIPEQGRLGFVRDDLPLLDNGVATGVGLVGGRPTVYAAAGSGSESRVSTAQLQALTRAARLAQRWSLPLLLIQDCGGYDPDDVGTAPFQEALAAAQAQLRELRRPLLVLVAGRGHVLGNYVLGGRTLGPAYVAAWPEADIGIRDVDRYAPLPQLPPDERGPWAAAAFSLIDDVFTAEETPARLGLILSLFEMAKDLPAPDHGNRAPGLPI